ncbi:hypothetical protein BGZ51_000713 [Haplosporangium sp. Z 767]|nr:hypothetical protein BGZ50_001516 [Haplosporangium sp. Z 11]KAF9188252.1 hypothetical protein BGZ51_000713 [Haplosporangium sp. Z 767]
MESILEQPTANLLPSTKHLDRTSLHLLPCGIQHNGKANINQFFFLVDGQYVSKTSEPAAAQVSASSELCTVIAETLEVTTTSTTTETVASDENGTATSTILMSATKATTETVVRTDTLPATSTPVPEVSFRGRTLKGTAISVPEGYIGSIYGSYDATAKHNSNNNSNSNGMDMDMDDEDQEYEAMLKGMQEERKTMRTKAQFKEFMVWGHDEQPSVKTNKVVKAMQWIDIAKVLHEPLC